MDKNQRSGTASLKINKTIIYIVCISLGVAQHLSVLDHVCKRHALYAGNPKRSFAASFDTL